MRFLIIGTSPDGATWYHSNYGSLARANMGLEDAIRTERDRDPIKAADARWGAAEAKVAGLPLGWPIALPNGWAFRIEKGDPS